MVIRLPLLSRLLVKRYLSSPDGKSNLAPRLVFNQTPGAAPYMIGVLGLAPFVASTVGIVYFPSSLEQLLYVQSIYGCSILSFLGAVHWGISMADPESRSSKPYVISVIPSLLGFSSCLIPHMPISLIIQGVGFLGLYGYERRLFNSHKIPKWYLNLRFGLTAGVLASITSTIVLDYVSNS